MPVWLLSTPRMSWTHPLISPGTILASPNDFQGRTDSTQIVTDRPKHPRWLIITWGSRSMRRRVELCRPRNWTMSTVGSFGRKTCSSNCPRPPARAHYTYLPSAQIEPLSLLSFTETMLTMPTGLRGISELKKRGISMILRRSWNSELGKSSC